MHQTKLSLQLRKRTLERSESVIPPSKRQIKDNTDGHISAFSAPQLEVKKITPPSTHVKPATTKIEQPKEKQGTRQTTLTQLAKPLSTPVNTSNADSKVDIGLTTVKSTEITSKPTLSQQEILLTKDSSTRHTTTPHDSASIIPPSTTTTEFESSPISNSPDSSPHTRSLKRASPPPLLEHQQTETDDTTSPLSSSVASVSTRKVPTEPKPSSVTMTESLPKPSSSSSPVVYDKSLLSKHDKGRIIEERSILGKLVSALDITLTFHAARNVAAFFHKIQPMLRNSTCKNITLSHLCKILFVAPELYDVETKLLKEYGKDIEAHQVSIGSIWTVPLSGKAIEERNDLMTKRSGEYFEEHKEEPATIPEKQLPRLDKVVDKKKWLQNATLPDRVRSVLELQEKRKAAKEEKANQPRIEPKGTAKDRAKALLDRIRNKQKK